MKKNQSYVFSVSLAPGCYRHIKISANAWLINLHSAILDAFEFDDDHAHAFFMNNRVWDDDDAYYAEMIDDEENHTTDYRLCDFDLKPGDKFCYVFDFGEEWRFGIKLLRTVDGDTDVPVVVREKGEAPPQYNYEFEEDTW